MIPDEDETLFLSVATDFLRSIGYGTGPLKPIKSVSI